MPVITAHNARVVISFVVVGHKCTRRRCQCMATTDHCYQTLLPITATKHHYQSLLPNITTNHCYQTPRPITAPNITTNHCYQTSLPITATKHHYQSRLSNITTNHCYQTSLPITAIKHHYQPPQWFSLANRRIVARDIATPNVLVFKTYRLFKNNIQTKRVITVNFQPLEISKTRFGNDIKFASFTTYSSLYGSYRQTNKSSPFHVKYNVFTRCITGLSNCHFVHPPYVPLTLPLRRRHVYT